MEFNFADRLKKTMDMRGMTQAQLAAASSQKEPTIHRYLKGKNKSPQIDILVKMASALNVTTDFLLGVTDIPNSSSNLSAEENLLLIAFSKANERDSALVWQILDVYLTPPQRGSLSQLRASGDKLEA